MERTISYSQFQQVKAAAKMIDPNIRKIEAIKKKIMPLVEEMKKYQALNDSLEEGIVKVIGFHVSDLVKKVIEPTGATDKFGKPVKATKYLPTDIVSYDEQRKVYVVNTEPITPPTAEETAGSDFEEDAAAAAEEDNTWEDTEEQGSGMPWDN